MPGELHTQLESLNPYIAKELFGCRYYFANLQGVWGRGEHPDGLGIFDKHFTMPDQDADHRDIHVQRADTLTLENKATRSDLLGDFEKASRAAGGVGHFGVYVTAEGICESHEIPAPWGWCEVIDNAPVMRVWPMRVNLTKAGQAQLTLLLGKALAGSLSADRPWDGIKARNRKGPKAPAKATAAQRQACIEVLKEGPAPQSMVARLSGLKANQVKAALTGCDEVEAHASGSVITYRMKEQLAG